MRRFQRDHYTPAKAGKKNEVIVPASCIAATYRRCSLKLAADAHAIEELEELSPIQKFLIGTEVARIEIQDIK